MIQAKGQMSTVRKGAWFKVDQVEGVGPNVDQGEGQCLMSTRERGSA